MQTDFSLAQLADPDIARANEILRACVHCGFCTATCPTYLTLGDERDSPRGRIVLIKDMLERDRPAPASVRTHIDRCLSCLSCMTTCPSGVHYMHLVDHARAHIEETGRRPLPDRALRALLAAVLPRPRLFRLALRCAAPARPLARLLPGRLKTLLALAPRRLPKPAPEDRPQSFPARGARRARVALLAGCAQQALAPEINRAAVRLLTRHGCETVVARGAGCCGALAHHMGRRRDALRAARRTIAAWRRETEAGGLDAIVVTASGCGTTIKDYGHMLRSDPAWAEDAAAVSARARDVSEWMRDIGLEAPESPPGGRVAYQSACSLRHGQKESSAAQALLAQAGFEVVEPAEAHLCCGSAGTYNMLQPRISERLRRRKLDALAACAPDMVASGNIGCMTQLAESAAPVLHTAQLLDWATGGPDPRPAAPRPA